MIRSRLRLADLARTASGGLRSRPVRAALSALGIAIGVAAIVAVVGITRSSQAQLLAQIDQLGTSLLVVANGHNVNGNEVELPAAATGRIGRIDGVQAVAPTAELIVAAVHDLLAATADPADPGQVAVSRPSDALAIRAAAAGTLNSLLLGVAAVALLVGAIGIANVMVISVIERRTEIGLRRALGAARGHVAAQFLAESVVLAALGAAGGLIVGVAVTLAVALNNGWSAQIPAPSLLLAGFVAALVIGALAGLYPAQRAARLSPTDALRAS